MKKAIYVIMAVWLVNLTAAGEQMVKANLSNVKVFLRGAELTHSAKVKIEKGVSDIVFTDVAKNIDQNSLNVSAKGEIVILSVVQKLDYLHQLESNPKIKTLNDSLNILNDKLSDKQNEIDVLKAEIDLIYANKEISGKDKAVSIIELQKMADFFRKRIGEIKTNITSCSKEIKKFQKDIDRISNQLAELNSKLNQPVNEIIVTVSAKNNTNAEFSLSYLIYDAGWQPVYDIRVDNIKSQAKLNYKANVRQNSGLDWNNVAVILSTRNPVQNNNKPELYPWYLDFTRPILYKEKMGMNRNIAAAPMVAESVVLTADAETMADYIEVNQNQLSTEFVPEIKYSIPSDNKNHIVELQSYSIPADYKYYAAPKVDNNAFLLAYLTNWNEYNLLPGQANIYFENSYVGQTYINPQISKDTLSISLGRDQNVIITRTAIKDFSEDKFLSSDIERTFALNIVVKNNKNVPLNILVEEQIPISKNEDIEVKLIDSSSGKLIGEEGKIKWNIEVEPSKSVTKKLIYSVRHPKDKTISNL